MRVSGIVHPTGADEIVLAHETAGGFTPPEWQAARLPGFTLYGDGRIVYVHTASPQPERTDNVFVGMPLRTTVFTEEQVQRPRLRAQGRRPRDCAGDLRQPHGRRRARHGLHGIDADNDTKTVSAMALGMENQPGPDTAVLAKLAALAELLGSFDGGKINSGEP